MAGIPRAPVVGLYGVSASGKSHLMNAVKHLRGTDQTTYYEGADVILQVFHGGLENFKRLPASEKAHYRQLAVQKIQDDTAKSGKLALVAGHYSFWDHDIQAPISAYTLQDWEVYSHIIYLNTPPNIILQQCRQDMTRQREPLSVTDIHKWQTSEIMQLREACITNDILFSVVSPNESLPDQIASRLADFLIHNEVHNLQCAKDKLNNTLQSSSDTIIVVLDADKTLAPVDSSTELVGEASKLLPHAIEKTALYQIFDGPMAYSYLAFRQAMLLNEDIAAVSPFEKMCDEISTCIQLHPEMETFLRAVCDQKHIGIVVMTCGLVHVWRKVIAKLQLPRSIGIIGGSLLKDGFVVTPQVKGELVSHMRNVHNKVVIAIGDSPVDLPMLKNAHQAFVAVPNEHIRSKSMEKSLRRAIQHEGLGACQILLPSTVAPRLNPTLLPVVELKQVLCDLEKQASILHIKKHTVDFTFNAAAKILATATRDSTISGPQLRCAHEEVGKYLALASLPEILGTEKYQIRHVQGSKTDGYKIKGGKNTTIIALMRGGEPMAFGVNSIIESAMFLHAKAAGDVKLHHINRQSAIIIVDSVVHSGASVVKFISHIRALSHDVKIVVMAGVVQLDSLKPDGLLGKALSQEDNVDVVALRLSENRYTGSGLTDTGNRLYNTTHLP